MTINLKLTQHWVPIFYLYYVIFHFSPPQYVCCPQFKLKCLCPLGYSEQKVIRLRCNAVLRLRLIRLKGIQKSEKTLNIFSVCAGEEKTQVQKCYTHPEYLIICLFTHPLCTRAIYLIVLPGLPGSNLTNWSHSVNLRHTAPRYEGPGPTPNPQKTKDSIGESSLILPALRYFKPLG